MASAQDREPAGASMLPLSSSGCSTPRILWTVMLSPLLVRPWPCLIDDQGAASERRSMQAGQRGLGLARVGHLDKAKASRAAGRPVLHDSDAGDDPIGVKEQRQLFLRRRKREIPDKNTHDTFLRGDRVSLAQPPHTARAPPAAAAHTATCPDTCPLSSCPPRVGPVSPQVSVPRDSQECHDTLTHLATGVRAQGF